MPLLDFFHQEITALQKTITVKKADPITGEEINDKELNMVRHTLENDWPIWKLAIRKSFEFQVEIYDGVCAIPEGKAPHFIRLYAHAFFE